MTSEIGKLIVEADTASPDDKHCDVSDSELNLNSELEKLPGIQRGNSSASIEYYDDGEPNVTKHRFNTMTVLGMVAAIMSILASIAVTVWFIGKENSDYEDPPMSQIAQKYLQKYSGTVISRMKNNQITVTEGIFLSYGKAYGGSSDIDTLRASCEIHRQALDMAVTNESSNVLNVWFTMTFILDSSNATKLAEQRPILVSYPGLFEKYMNSKAGRDRLHTDLRNIGVAVDTVGMVIPRATSGPTLEPLTFNPTSSLHPSVSPSPTEKPTVSVAPSKMRTLESLVLVQQGNMMIGQSANENFGSSISLSKQGTHLAIGSPLHNSEIGSFAVFSFNKNIDRWVQQIIHSIDTTTQNKNGDNTGRCVSLSQNGDYLAVGSPSSQFYSSPGAVSFYKLSDDHATDQHISWSPLGSNTTIIGKLEYFEFGRGVSLSRSSDGILRVAVGALTYARLYEFQNDVWVQLGEDIMDHDSPTTSLLWASISLSGDGEQLAVVFRNDDFKGTIKIFTYYQRSNLLRQVGQDLVGEGEDGFGYSVSLSENGTRVAIGTWDGNYVLVMELSEETGELEWETLGEFITGESPDNESFGHSVSLSWDGTRLVIGSPLYKDEFQNQGRVRLYALVGNVEGSNSSWVLIDEAIGTGKNDRFGGAVSISSTGQCLAVGSPYSDLSGDSSGSVEAFCAVSIE